MKCVSKGQEPKPLKKYGQRFRHEFKKWSEYVTNRARADAVRDQLQQDQKGICAYCEIDLTVTDRSVEHFVPCTLSTKDHNWNLDWQNMLLTCRGGLDPDAGEADDTYRRSLEPHKEPCCNRAKGGFENVAELLNPLKLNCDRAAFQFDLQTGEILPNNSNCEAMQVAPDIAQRTIEVLNLNVQRLKDNRRELINELYRELETSKDDLDTAEIRLAEAMFGDGTHDWPAFFTTIRWALGEAAEQYLRSIGFNG